MAIALNGKKSAPRSVNNNKTYQFDAMTSALLEIVEPYVAAVNAVPASRDHAAADTGHAKPITTDIPMQMILGNVLSYCNRQLCGEIKTKSGTYPNAMELLEKNQKRLAEIDEEFDNPNLTVTGQIKLQEELENRLYYHKKNEEWVTLLNSMITSFNTVYYTILGKNWEAPKTEKPESTLAKANPEQRQKMLEEARASLKAAIASGKVAA